MQRLQGWREPDATAELKGQGGWSTGSRQRMFGVRLARERRGRALWAVLRSVAFLLRAAGSHYRIEAGE